jgi:hypothetical protein
MEIIGFSGQLAVFQQEMFTCIVLSLYKKIRENDITFEKFLCQETSFFSLRAITRPAQIAYERLQAC